MISDMDRPLTTFLCDICTKTYRNVSSLKRHINIHGNENDDVKCKHCLKTFTRADSLVRHMKSNHSQSKSVLLCPHCGTEFIKTRNSLSTHIRYKHRESAGQKCEQCRKIFRDSYDLQKNERAIHDKPDLSKNNVRSRKKSNKSGNSVRCSDYDKTFKNRTCMKRHQGKIHNLQNNQTYKCPCGKEYKYRYYLACHKKACIKTIGSIPLERLKGAARLSDV